MQLTQTTLAIAIVAALVAPAACAEALKPTANWEGSLILEGVYFDSNKSEVL